MGGKAPCRCRLGTNLAPLSPRLRRTFSHAPDTVRPRSDDTSRAPTGRNCLISINAGRVAIEKSIKNLCQALGEADHASGPNRKILVVARRGNPCRLAVILRSCAGPAGCRGHGRAERPGPHWPGLLQHHQSVRDGHDRRRRQLLHQQRATDPILHEQSAGHHCPHERGHPVRPRLHLGRCHQCGGRLHCGVQLNPGADVRAGARRPGAALRARLAHHRERPRGHLRAVWKRRADQHQLRPQGPAQRHPHARTVGQRRGVAGIPDRRQRRSQLPEWRPTVGDQLHQSADDQWLRPRLSAQRRRRQHLRRRRRPRRQRLPGAVLRHEQYLQRPRSPERRLAGRIAGRPEAARRRILCRSRIHAHDVGARVPRRDAPADARHAPARDGSGGGRGCQGADESHRAAGFRGGATDLAAESKRQFPNGGQKRTDAGGVWFAPYGSAGTLYGDSTTHSTSYGLYGFAAGGDLRIADAVLLGMSLSYSHNAFSTSIPTNNGTNEAVSVAAYASYAPDAWYVDAALGYAY
ncbi:MAG: autotransporter outer membrane beta-barrel domain-containing protein, partial [Reyranella sp.]